MNFITKKIKSYQLNKKQKKIDELYAEQGPTDEVLELQLEVNGLRNELDIPDKSNIINDEGYVQ